MESWKVRNGHEEPGSGVRSWESKGRRAKSKEFGCHWSHEGPFLEMQPSVDDFRQIINDLQRVREAGVRVFGSDSHGFEVNEVMSEKEVQRFEMKHGIRLPIDYRMFLLHVGRGGAGPAYGLFDLGEMDDGHEMKKWRANGSFVGRISEDFPGARFLRKGSWTSLDGAIPICHLGCALRQWLVVSGKEAGSVWNDNRADEAGIEPWRFREQRRSTFYTWYRSWLDEAVAILCRSLGKRFVRNV